MQHVHFEQIGKKNHGIKCQVFLRFFQLLVFEDLKSDLFIVLSLLFFTITEYLCHKWPRICSVCRNDNPLLSSFMTYITGYVTRVTRHVPLTLPEHLSSPMVFSVVRVAPSFVFYVVFCILLFVSSSFFPLVIVLSARLRFTISDYSLGMFKLPKRNKILFWYMWSNTLFHYAVFNRVVIFKEIMFLYVLSSVWWCPLRFPHVRFIFSSSCL